MLDKKWITLLRYKCLNIRGAEWTLTAKSTIGKPQEYLDITREQALRIIKYFEKHELNTNEIDYYNRIDDWRVKLTEQLIRLDQSLQYIQANIKKIQEKLEEGEVDIF